MCAPDLGSGDTVQSWDANIPLQTAQQTQWLYSVCRFSNVNSDFRSGDTKSLTFFHEIEITSNLKGGSVYVVTAQVLCICRKVDNGAVDWRDGEFYTLRVTATTE